MPTIDRVVVLGPRSGGAARASALALCVGATACGATGGSLPGASREVAIALDASTSDASVMDASVADPGVGASDAGSVTLILGDGVSTAVADDAAPRMTSMLAVTVRDFRFWDALDPTTNPDFENALGSDHGTIVASVLGADHKPVYKNPTGVTPTTHGKKYFDQWYNDAPGTNVSVQYPLTLTTGVQGTYGYDSAVSGVALGPGDPKRMWFPIDDGTPYATPFGNQGQPHNYSFTTELHTVFVYGGGETFSFTGDDDVFVFIDNRLVIDLGGIHTKEEGQVQLDALGLVRGQQYALDLFNAERHTSESNLSFTTTLHLQSPPK